MRPKLLVVLIAVMLCAVVVSAETSHMALDREGTLYRAIRGKEQLLLEIKAPGGQPEVVPVPQTMGDMINVTLVSIDQSSGAVVLVWQELVDHVFKRIMVASLMEGVWFGPVEIAGDEYSWATNPAMLVHTTQSELEDGSSLASTFVHLVWWTGENLDDGGHATGVSIPLDGGQIVLDEAVNISLEDLIPYGVACDMTGEEATLKHPKLFVDPQTGSPHILFVDLRDCLFGIVQLAPTVPEISDSTVSSQRRRHIIVWRDRMIIPVHPDLVLAGAKFDVGFNLAVVMYWDKDQAIDYALLDESSWSEIRSLPLTEQIDHEQGVSLIRRLAK
jgi:hypothetical protein